MAELRDSPTTKPRTLAWAAVVVGALAQLGIPWGIVCSAREIAVVANTVGPPGVDEFFRLYWEILVASRSFLAAASVSTVGTALLAWGAIRAVVRRV